MFELISRGEYDGCEGEDWSSVSELAKDLIRRMLVVDIGKRFTIKQVCQHPWLQQTRRGPAKGRRSNSVLDGAQRQLRKLLARRRFKKGIKAVMATVKMKGLIGGLHFVTKGERTTFRPPAADGDGEDDAVGEEEVDKGESKE